MNAISKHDMIRATRLTRAGRLKDAMALLRGVLKPGAAAPPALDLAGSFGALARHGGKPHPIPGARFETRSFESPIGKRTYKLFISSKYHGQALPLVVMLHGCTQSPDDFAAGTRMNELAEAEGFFVAYPAQSRGANMSKCWNWFNAAEQTRGAGEPEIIAGITRQVMQDVAVTPGRVFAAGLSAGGAMAAILGANYPDLYAAIGVHSGLACGAARDAASAFGAMRGAAAGQMPKTAIPTIVFHGDHDKTVHPANAEMVIAQSNSSTLDGIVTHGAAPDGATFTRTVQTGADGKPVLEKWILHGAGHAWSGGSKDGTFASTTGPDASREMWRFFLASSAPGQFKWF